MLVVSDIDDVFLPSTEGVFVNPADSRCVVLLQAPSDTPAFLCPVIVGVGYRASSDPTDRQ